MLRILNISYNLKIIPKLPFHFITALHPYQARTKAVPSPDICQFLTIDILTFSPFQVSTFFGKKTPRLWRGGSTVIASEAKQSGLFLSESLHSKHGN